jgi:hypothetical protein
MQVLSLSAICRRCGLLDRLSREHVEVGKATTASAIKTSKLMNLVQPRLASFVYRTVTTAFDKAVDASVTRASALGLPHPDLASLSVTHPAHVINNLHRALGFPGCPTAPVWPKPWEAFPCVPVTGVILLDEHGVERIGAAVGCSVPVSALPFTTVDEPAGVLVVMEVPVGSSDLVREFLVWCAVDRCCSFVPRTRLWLGSQYHLEAAPPFPCVLVV